MAEIFFLLTICEAQHPQSRYGELRKVIPLPRPVVGRVVHLLRSVEPLVGHHRHSDDEQGHRRRDRGYNPEERQSRFEDA